MKFPVSDLVETRSAPLSGEASPEQAPADVVLFEMGVIVAAHLAVALSVILTLRVFGLVGA